VRERERNQREEGDDADNVGPRVSEVGGREGGTGSVFAYWAAGCFNFWAERFPPRPFSIFLFSSLFLFCFLISFVTFANMLQINSNHFHKFCKIHSKVSNQHQTCFQNQSKVFNKRSWLSLMALLA
jgi:hypothetical protein